MARRQDHALKDQARCCPLAAAAESAGTPVIMTGRSRHAVHQVTGRVSVRLVHQSPPQSSLSPNRMEAT